MSDLLDRYTGMVEVARLTAPGMVALRGELADARLSTALGFPVPALRRWTEGEGLRALWMSPDELLLIVPDAAAAMARIEGALSGGFFTLADMSDLRAVFTIRGAHSRDVLAKLMPVDFSDFPTGSVRRTRAAQVAALVWRDEGDAFGLMCMRSVADYMAELLKTAARPGGEIGLYR
jgi:sarcosine oxidase, subunit gamma